jgi:uncharacterized protein YjiS (DUF1127 family)
MSSTQAMCTQSPAHGIAHANGHGLVQSVKALWRAYWARRARRTSILLLSSLDSRTLHDIGLDRSEIASFVNDRTNQRLRRYETNWE